MRSLPSCRCNMGESSRGDRVLSCTDAKAHLTGLQKLEPRILASGFDCWENTAEALLCPGLGLDVPRESANKLRDL